MSGPRLCYILRRCKSLSFWLSSFPRLLVFSFSLLSHRVTMLVGIRLRHTGQEYDMHGARVSVSCRLPSQSTAGQQCDSFHLSSVQWHYRSVSYEYEKMERRKEWAGSAQNNSLLMMLTKYWFLTLSAYLAVHLTAWTASMGTDLTREKRAPFNGDHMLPIMIVMGVMFAGMCVALNLFSRSVIITSNSYVAFLCDS